MITHESYVSLETARLLKQAGFDWECEYGYDADGKTCCSPYTCIYIPWNDGTTECCSKPSLAVAQRWLREEQGFLLSVELAENDYDALWYWSICRFCNNEGLTSVDWYGDQWLEAEEKFRKNEEQSYEQALEAGINKCLTILLEEKK